jgi:peptidoglycan hydrolase-like protein with peptidoglycan-binding domain
VAIADISQKWGPYVGWSTTLMGVALPFGRTPGGMLGLGSTGEDVRRLQNTLIAHGVIADTSGNHDGVFGPGLDAAVRRFQQEHNLVVDGVVGPQTLAALS